MTRISLFVCCLCILRGTVSGQTNKSYNEYIRDAEVFLNEKEYLKAATAYSKAFSSNNNRGRIDHRYHAARSWGLAGNSDSAYYHLEKIVKSGNYISCYLASIEPAFLSLHTLNKWSSLIAEIKENKERLHPKLDEHLAANLDTILRDDQSPREELNKIEKKEGFSSTKRDSLMKVITRNDQLNLMKIGQILQKYGWPDKETVGVTHTETIFLVIQHSPDLTIQEKYLGLVEKAVLDKKLPPSCKAILEDKIASRHSKLQRYGSQLFPDPLKHTYFVWPLLDPEKVDLWRSEVGLMPMKDYVKKWGINWSLEQYYKDIPRNIKIVD